MKSVKQSIEKAILTTQREEAKRQGFYDGRFRSRIEADKKRKESRNACRQTKAFLTSLFSLLLCFSLSAQWGQDNDLHQFTVKQSVLPNDSAATYISYDYTPLSLGVEQVRVYITPVEVEISKNLYGVRAAKIGIFGFLSPSTNRVRLYANPQISPISFVKRQRWDWEINNREMQWMFSPTLEISVGASFDIVNTGWDFLTISVEWNHRYVMEMFAKHNTVVGEEYHYGNLRVGLQYLMNRTRYAALDCPSF